MGVLQNIIGMFTGGATAGIPADKQGYVGTWTGEGTELTITPEGEVRFRESKTVVTADGTSSKSRSVTGPIARWEGASFVVGMMGRDTAFRVDAPPTPDGRMTVDGVALVRRG